MGCIDDEYLNVFGSYKEAKDYIDEVKNDFYCSKELEKMETLDPSYEESWLGIDEVYGVQRVFTIFKKEV